MEESPSLAAAKNEYTFGDHARASARLPCEGSCRSGECPIAALHGMDFLVTWNCAHIANAAIAKALAVICRQHACECPVICTPDPNRSGVHAGFT
jgi:hypothetical protein